MYRLEPKLEMSKNIHVTHDVDKINQEILKIIKEKNIKTTIYEAYPGVKTEEWIQDLNNKSVDTLVVDTDDLYISAEDITADIQDDLTADEVFGRFTHTPFKKYLDPLKIKKLYQKLPNFDHVIIVGVGASEIVDANLVVFLDITRWETQLRQRAGMKNWKSIKDDTDYAKLKRSYYFEWPAADQIKDKLLPIVDFYIDTNDLEDPKLLTGQDMREMLKEFTTQPFQLKPYFDKGVWGGHWMQETFNVGKDEVNLAWCFDGVPEENSILMETGEEIIEMPAYNVVTLYPIELLGEKVFGRFGRDYPIRFNILDTLGGQNLSLQVHPTLDYAYFNFGAKYTQDESYYVLEAEDDAVVYLGVKDGVTKEELVQAFEDSQITGEFNDEKYINQIPMKKHDHYLIPGGTIHSSGKNSVVLEISSTPNRFTFKLWDWGRVDLNGKPRPISLHHGRHVINTDFNTKFVNKELYNQFEIIEENELYTEEKTGLHAREAVETRRLTIYDEVTQRTENSTNMLKLVEGKHIQVISHEDAFEPYDVYFGETFILPEKVKNYTLKTIDEKAIVIKAYIR